MIRAFAIAGTLLLAACGTSEEGAKKGAETAKEQPKGNFTISSPVKFSQDAGERQKQQEALVAMMISDPNVPLDVIEGEAVRRGVKLTPDQIATKKTQKPGDPRPEANSAPTDNSAEAQP